MITRVAEAGSTNADLAERGRAGAPHGSALVADRQTGGRGRLGRVWESGDGNLALSVLVRPLFALDRVPLICLAAAVTVCEALGEPFRIKWPNDVLAPDGRKVAGILAEVDADGTIVRHVVVGIGVNLVSAPLPTAACVGEYADPPDRMHLAERIVAGIVARTAILAADPSRVLDEWRSRSHTLGQRVRIGDIEGQAVDIGADGALIVRTTSGTHPILAGDVEMIGRIAR